ncbi:MAG TPA: glycosyltransferase [Bryobacteraceae bacterium]|jgi:4-amino-4-deoxy-L-arabinose transferase-like glycosyltransferase
MTDGIAYAVIIPAYRPGAELPDLVRALAARAVPAIILVDDGSGARYEDSFAQAAALPGVHLVRHAANQGKGAALKSGIRYALATFPGLAGVVTADADGQHDAADILRIAQILLAEPDALVLGARTFSGQVPWRSRFGNLLTRSVLRAAIGSKLADTQTGLRGVPAALAAQLPAIAANGYEFELEMLIAAHRAGVRIVEQSIRTIYEAGNPQSHFSPIVDSMKIYFVLLRFASVSLVTAALDNLVFFFVYRATGHILGSQALSRALAAAFQYGAVRRPVFHSQRSHRQVLPKYLALLLASGAASYAGIRALVAWLGIGAVPAKLIVETILFFGNFVVLRGFIFRRGQVENGGSAPPAKPARLGWLLAALAAALVGLEIYGVASGGLFAKDIWHPLGLEHLASYTAAWLSLGLPVLIFLPWLFVPLVLAGGLVLSAVAAGPLAVLAPVLFLVSSCALGCALLRPREDRIETQLLATLLGGSVFVFAMYLTARLPVHYPAVWLAALAAPVALGWRGVLRRARAVAAQLRTVARGAPAERFALAFLLFILGIHWLVTLKPEAGADALAMHLAIPANIAAHHAFSIQPARLLWSVMPMGADFGFSIVYLLGGEMAARLLNLAWLLALEGLLYGAVRRWLPRSPAWLLAALFAATPLVELVTGSLFIENLLAALILGMMVALWRYAESGSPRFLFAAAVLAGSALSTKFGAFAFVVPALPFFVWEARRRPRPAGAGWLAMALAGAAALPPYVIAWWKTGDPLFPYLGKLFPHSMAPAPNIITDSRFHAPLQLRTLFDLTFHTHNFYEGQDGSFGFQYLLLIPLVLAGVWAARNRAAASAAVVALVSCLIVLPAQPNARYIYASLPLWIAAFAAVLAWTRDRHAWIYRGAIVLFACAAALGVWFLPSSSWYHKEFYLDRPFEWMRAPRAVNEVSPFREVARYAASRYPASAVLLTRENDIADLAGDAHEYNWHELPLDLSISATRSLPAMIRLMEQWHIRYFVTHEMRRERLRPPALLHLLGRCTIQERSFGVYSLAVLDPACESASEAALKQRVSDAPLETCPAGTYDDFDPLIRFRGDWTQDEVSSDGALSQTLTYTAEPGAEAGLAFDGHSLTYVYTRAWNRGIAEIVIDGVTRGSVDLYSPRIEWQSRVAYCCFAPGRHELTIRATGRHSPAATASFIDVDALIVDP